MEAHSFTHERKTYGAVLGALLVLTVITVYVASFDFGNLNVVVALAIASAKASLVALFFMHLKYDKPINAVIFLIGVFILAVFLIFTLIDVDTRGLVRPANHAAPMGGPATAEAAAGQGAPSGTQ